MRTTTLRRCRALHLAPSLLALCLLVAACSGFTRRVELLFGGEVTLYLRLDSRLNQDLPLAVDFVVVYDPDLYTELAKMTAADWFARKGQLAQDHTPRHMEVSSWEWVPPDCSCCRGPGAQTIEYRVGAEGGVLFANYFNPGTHRIKVEPLRSFTLVLGETEAAGAPPPSRAELAAAREEAERRCGSATSKDGAGLRAR